MGQDSRGDDKGYRITMGDTILMAQAQSNRLKPIHTPGDKGHVTFKKLLQAWGDLQRYKKTV